MMARLIYFCGRGGMLIQSLFTFLFGSAKERAKVSTIVVPCVLLPGITAPWTRGTRELFESFLLARMMLFFFGRFFPAYPTPRDGLPSGETKQSTVDLVEMPPSTRKDLQAPALHIF